MSTRHLYPLGRLYSDYSRAGLGLLLTIPALVMLEPGAVFTFIMLLVVGLCLYSLFRTWEVQQTVVMLEEQTLTVKGMNTIMLEWPQVTSVNLAFFSSRSDKSDGLMRLTLEAGDRKVKIDSRIHDFISIVRRAARAIGENSLRIDGITRANLQALGIYIY
jgi:hypothetical protein